MYLSELKVQEPFSSLFPIDNKVFWELVFSMRSDGYDLSQPITVWKGRNIVIDGHTRLAAAEHIGRRFVAVYERDFENENAALEYALHNQRDRRNLSDADILHLVEKLDNLYERGGDRRSIFATTKVDSSDGDNKMSTKYKSSRHSTAEMIGTTAEKVSQCRHVWKNCTPAEIREILNGKISLYKVYKRSLTGKQKEEKKVKEHEINLKKLQELKLKDFPVSSGKSGDHEFAKIAEKLDSLVLKLLPNLDKRASEMSELRDNVEYFKSKGDETFKIFCERVPVKGFLESSFVNDFIEVLRCFGYGIETPRALNIKPEQRIVPVKKKRPVPPPHANIARVYEIDFISKADRQEMDKHQERVMEWNNM
jgi:ParB family chromosome partitioning protein